MFLINFRYLISAGCNGKLHVFKDLNDKPISTTKCSTNFVSAVALVCISIF